MSRKPKKGKYILKNTGVRSTSEKGRAGNSLIHSSLIRSIAQIAQIKWATVSDSLRSLRTNERLWANRSCRSWQKSNHERIAQVAYDKRVTVSDSLRLLMIKEQMSESLVFFLTNSSFALLLTKKNESLKIFWIKSYFFVYF